MICRQSKQEQFFLCCGHACAVKLLAAKINVWGPMRKFYSVHSLLVARCKKFPLVSGNIWEFLFLYA